MTVKGIAEKLGLTPVSVADDAREVQGGYAGDLLSWVMGRVPEGAAWVTIMTNVNVVAVAVLRDVAMGIGDPRRRDRTRARAGGQPLFRHRRCVYGLRRAVAAARMNDEKVLL